MEHQSRLGRRAMLCGSSLLLGSAWLRGAAIDSPALNFGIVTDVHYADKPHWGNRYYRESLAKLEDGVKQFRGSNLSFLMQLGDLVDAAQDLDTERDWLQRAIGTLSTAGLRMHSVLGNHCIQTLTKVQFLKEVGQERGHYSFDLAGFRFLVLDACYRRDGVSYDAGNFDWKDSEIPPAQREWLKEQLDLAPGRALVFVHQRLDIPGVHAVASAPEIRSLLEASGKVVAVFQGHSHQNDYREINRIHYCTMRAVIEGSGPDNNGYSIVSVFEDGRLIVKGFRAQQNYQIA